MAQPVIQARVALFLCQHAAELQQFPTDIPEALKVLEEHWPLILNVNEEVVRASLTNTLCELVSE